MNFLHAYRAASLLLLVLCTCTKLAVAAYNYSLASKDSTLAIIDVFLIVFSSVTIVFLLPVILVDIFRRGALTSKVWFELAWLCLFWVLDLAGAAATTADVSRSICDPITCGSSQALVALAWLDSSLIFSHLLILFVSAMCHNKEYPDVWITSVRDFQWFGGGTGTRTLGSNPSSPVAAGFKPKRFSLQAASIPVQHPYPQFPVDVESMTPAQRIRHQAMGGEVHSPPMPSCYSTRPVSYIPRQSRVAISAASPEEPRAPIHYSASSNVALGGLPSRRSSRENAPVSFYSSSMQKSLALIQQENASSAQLFLPPAPTQNAPQPFNNKTNSDFRSTSTKTPPPIRNWPRTNPLDSARPAHGRRTPSDVSQTEGGGATTSPSRTSVTRSSRPRPPPLDLSALSAINPRAK